jgi:hypothetical protein
MTINKSETYRVLLWCRRSCLLPLEARLGETHCECRVFTIDDSHVPVGITETAVWSLRFFRVLRDMAVS